ncbi:MAG: hypothetical protein PHI90_11050 [Clostridia bacterium]|nr:hypothetical protein [Clostridia bacterium]
MQEKETRTDLSFEVLENLNFGREVMNMITRGKKKILFLVLLLLSLTIIFSGCVYQNDNVIKVDEPNDGKIQPVINKKTESGKTSGVLLGIKCKNEDYDESRYDTMNSEDEKKPQYKTLYITNNEGNVTLSVQGSGILVPRNDGFWLLNIETERLKDKYKDFDYESDVDYISAKKVDGGSVKEPIKKYNSKELAKKWCEFYNSNNNVNNRYYDYNIWSELIFVGNNYITQRVTSYGYIGGQKNVSFNCLMTIPFKETNKIDVYIDEVRELEERNDNTDVKEVSISELLGNDARNQFLKEGNTYLVNNSFYGLYVGDGFGFFRQNGEWIVKGYLLSGNCNGIYEIFDTNIIPTKQIVSHDILIPNWEIIKTFIPDAKDVFSSPEKDMLIVLTSKELRVYTDFKDDYIGEVVYVIDLKDIIDSEEEKEVDVIMAQWATGNYVEKWENEAKKYLNDN